jgi:hypothetical protein
MESRNKLAKLHEKYCKGERTIEQTARMVGLRLPQTQQHKSEQKEYKNYEFVKDDRQI